MNKNEAESTEIELQLKSPDSAAMLAFLQGHLYVLGPGGVAGVPSGHALIEKFDKIFTIKCPNDFLFLFCFARMSTLKMADIYISRPVQTRLLIG